MKNLLKLTLLSSALLIVVGCSEDYLEKEPSEFLTQAQVSKAAENNPDVLAGTLAGIYSLQFESGSGGTGSHTDFGQKGYDIYGDMLSGDMALSVSSFGWYRADITEFQAPLDFLRNSNYQPWRYYYRIIRSANLVIDALGGNDAVPEVEENKYILGQTKAMRAHSYFYLTQYYQKEYDPNEEILPIYVAPEDENGPKVPASQIYDLIEKDLNDAITLLDGFGRAAKNEINVPVAKGILAYVLASKDTPEAWGQVKTLTDEVIAEGYPIMTESEVAPIDAAEVNLTRNDGTISGGGFNDLNTPGWMWGVDLTSDSGVGLVSWWGQMDFFSFSYAGYGDYKAMDSDLYDQMSDDDVRKRQFFSDPEGANYLQPWGKFYDPRRVPRGASRVVTNDLVYMRIAEMYLLNAEAAANLGMDADARMSLAALLDLRVDDTSYLDGLSGEALIDEIYLQTRLELWGEGKSYLALKRNKKTVVRGPNHLSFVGEPIPYNDERLTFEIPEAEILYNPAISTQND
ncbi:RagB/SusD family nutrient uptake outer membrane protein [Salegentibacter sp. JZCK2]|uniref:RagB/SusD family nutrient uptake outer membrane protein n=1 Tax=Salegentibacter tibetensis TaxID=2873600 RepID=UPI001CCA549E|nr:RagB/SusD family nutrient uptake outer membrane protein [Salegentibacter tibetensis]MBZ9731409.1 RagB/SusD family nutrient uptake outer membrane protein [Salegentibacter tibetensis]